MPQKMWKHTCSVTGVLIWLAIDTCPECRQAGEYDGWHYTMYEAMANYQNRYGLKPIGPHRQFADQLFSGMTNKCLKCNGKGLIDINYGEGYQACPACNGTGHIFNQSEKEIEKIRQQVISAFPDAAVEAKITDVTAARVGLNLETGVVEDLGCGKTLTVHALSNQIRNSAQSARGRPWLQRFKIVAKAILFLLAILVGIRQCLWETVSYVSDLGMDDLGRQVLCQTVDQATKDIDDVEVRCEGFHRRTIVISLKNSMPILFGNIKPSDAIELMKRPYTEDLFGFTGITLRGDKLLNKLDNPTPILEIHSRLQSLGAKTIGDFFAACGFEKYLIRDEEQKTNYLEVTFSKEHYGSNPIAISGPAAVIYELEGRK